MAQITLNTRKRIIAMIGMLCAIGALSFCAFSFGLLDRFENASWDRRLRSVSTFGQTHRADPRIRIITIDQSSLDYFSQEEKIVWPWPRALYEPVLQFLKVAGARAVVFDILFTEPSSYGVFDDETFSNALKAGPPSVVATALRKASSSLESSEEKLAEWKEFRKIQARNIQPSNALSLNSASKNKFSSAILPIPPIMRSVNGLGDVSAEPDFDGIFRHAKAGAAVDGVPILSLPFALFSLFEPQAMIDYQQRFAVRFAGPARTYGTQPIAAVIKNFTQALAEQRQSVDSALYKDAFVFIGMDAPGLLDLRPTPLSEVFPGVEFNATVLDNLLHDSFVHRTSKLESVSITVILAFLLAFAVLFSVKLRYQMTVSTLIAALFIALAFATAAAGIWIPMAVPIMCGVIVVLLSLAFQYQLEGKQHRFLRHAFRHYVSSDVVDEIVENPAALAIGGERRELTMFFSDIEGFTKISEKLEVSKLVILLNSFFSEMSQIIMAHGGTVDKYVGDAIVAFWNAPVLRSDHAERAVNAALACQSKLTSLQNYYTEQFGVAVRMRIGIHTGVVNVGNFGSKDRFNYTMIGDAANLASRLEGANKHFGTAVLVSEATQQAACSKISFRKVAQILVIGKKQPTVVYEPYFITEHGYELFNAGRSAFEAADLVRALEIFRPLAKQDPVAARYVERIESVQSELSLEELNANRFSKVFELTEK